MKAKCGTHAGHSEHARNKEPQCKECSDWWRSYIAIRRMRRGMIKSASVPYEVLGVLLRMVPAETSEWAKERIGAGGVACALEAADNEALTELLEGGP